MRDGRSAQTNPGVERAIGEVGHQICRDDDDAKNQDSRLNHLVVPLKYRLIDNAADTRPGEYRF